MIAVLRGLLSLVVAGIGVLLVIGVVAGIIEVPILLFVPNLLLPLTHPLPLWGNVLVVIVSGVVIVAEGFLARFCFRIAGKLALP